MSELMTRSCMQAVARLIGVCSCLAYSYLSFLETSTIQFSAALLSPLQSYVFELFSSFRQHLQLDFYDCVRCTEKAQMYMRSVLAYLGVAMVAAGAYHTVVLSSDGRAVSFGLCSPSRSSEHWFPGQGWEIPALPKGLTYTQAAAGHWHTVLLRSDGTAIACGRNLEGECEIPILEDGMFYNSVVAGHDHTVLLKSDGTAVAVGCDDHGQCQIPPLQAGVSYTHAAAGLHHTVLIKSDGTAVAVGGLRRSRHRHNCKLAPQCTIPTLEPGVTYTQAAAGYNHTVLLRSDGTAITFGDRLQDCNTSDSLRIPALPEGVTYHQVAAGLYHTVLLRSDGTVVAIGGREESVAACQIPILPSAITYTQVAAGRSHTVLLTSDGTVIALGYNNHGQCRIPSLPEGITYCPAATVLRRIFQAQFQLQGGDVFIHLLELSGKEYCSMKVLPTEPLAELQRRCSAALAVPSCAIVLPQGVLLSNATLQNPAATLSELLYTTKCRR